MKPNCGKMKIDVQKIRNRSSQKFNTISRTQNAVPGSNMKTSQRIQDGGRTSYWKSFFFCYISAPHCPTKCDIWREEAESHPVLQTQRHDQNCKFAHERLRLAWLTTKTTPPHRPTWLSGHTTPQSATLGLHLVIHVPNYMDHYSFTDHWGMDGWVGDAHVYQKSFTEIFIKYCNVYETHGKYIRTCMMSSTTIDRQSFNKAL